MGRIIFIIGAAFLILSLIIPWVDVKGITSFYGYDSDGIFSGMAGIAALIIGIVYKGKSDKPYCLPGILLALVPLFITINMVMNMLSITSFRQMSLLGNVTITGILVAGLGTFLIIVGSLIRVEIKEG